MGTPSHGYDDIDQLTSESRTGYSASYTYDANGNRLTKTLAGVTDTYNYDTTGADKLMSISRGGTTIKSYTYDAAGRTKTVVTSAGTTTLDYDYSDRDNRDHLSELDHQHLHLQRARQPCREDRLVRHLHV